MATGQTPNNSIVKDLPPSTSTSITNPDNGFIRIRPTMQFQDPKYPNLFAVGDIADTGVRKAAKPGAAQAAVVAKNIHALIEGREPVEGFPRMPAAIHITLGHVSFPFLLLKNVRVLTMDYRNTISSSATRMWPKVRLSRLLSRSLSKYCPIFSYTDRSKLT